MTDRKPPGIHRPASTTRHLIVCLMMMLLPLSAAAQTAKEWRDSLDVLRRQIAQSPYSSDLHLRKAAVNIELGQWEYAADEYGFILGKEPDNLAALYYRAYVNSRLQRYTLALNDYERFLSIAPNNIEARLGLAYVLRKLDKRQDALDQINRLAELFPDSAVVYATRAALEREMNAYDAALLDWEEAIRREPDNTDFMLSKADILILLGRKTAAKTVLDSIASRGIPQGMLREWYKRCK